MLVLILTPTFSNIYMVSKIREAFKKEIPDNNKFLLKSVAVSIDSVFAETEALRAALADDAGGAAVASKNSLDKYTLYDAAKLVGNLNIMLRSRNYIDTFYIYCPKSDLVVLPDLYYESDLYYERKIAPSEISRADWKRKLGSIAAREIFEGKQAEDGQSAEIVNFLIPVSAAGELSFVINITVRKDALFGNVSELSSGGKTAMAVLKSRGDVLFTYGNKGGAVSFEALERVNEFYIEEIDLNGNKMNISYVRSAINRNRYVYLFSSNEANSRIDAAVAVVVTGTFISLALMLVILYCFNGWNYKQLKLILNSFGIEAAKRKSEFNEYSAIIKRINDAKNRASQLESDIDTMKAVIKNSFFTDFIKGYTDIKEFSKRLAQYGVNFEYGAFALSAVKILDIGVVGYGSVREAVFIVDNIITDCLCNADLRFFAIKADGLLFYIVNARSEADAESEIKNLFDTVLDISRKELNLNFIATVSGFKNSLTALPDMYNEAVSAPELMDFYGIDAFVSYNDAKTDFEAPSLGNFNAANENSLIFAFKDGNADEAGKLLKKLFEVKNGYPDKWRSKITAYNIINTAIKTADNQNGAETEEILRYVSDVEKLSE
jgi:hypothetical protein